MAIFKSLKKASQSPEDVTTLKIKVKDKLPLELLSFKNLTALYLQSDELEEIDIPLFKLENLQTLYIQSKKLELVPSHITKCPSLISLNLKNCNIKHFCIR